jgi:hypothetical protein
MKQKNSHSGCLSLFNRGRTPIVLAILMALFWSFEPYVYPCSVIAKRALSGELFMGANYDWKARGGIVYLSPRGQRKSVNYGVADGGDKPIGWISRYASLTVSQFGRDYPMQGINERGLSGVVLMAPSSYPEVGRSGVITENLWLQYQLDQYTNISEVYDHLDDLGVKKISADLHWFLCDATGECATVEFSDGRAKMYRYKDTRRQLITNSPVTQSWKFYEDWMASSRPLPQGYASFARFTRMAWHAEFNSDASLISILDDVAAKGFTAWQSLLNRSQPAMSIRLDGGHWFDISVAGLDLDCRKDLPIFNLEIGQWQPYSPQTVRELLLRATEAIDENESKAIELQVERSEAVFCN